MCEGAIVVNVALKMSNVFDMIHDPANEGDKGDVDVIRASAPEAIAPVDILAVTVHNCLFKHPHWVHGNVTVRFGYVGFMHV